MRSEAYSYICRVSKTNEFVQKTQALPAGMLLRAARGTRSWVHARWCLSGATGQCPCVWIRSMIAPAIAFQPQFSGYFARTLFPHALARTRHRRGWRAYSHAGHGKEQTLTKQPFPQEEACGTIGGRGADQFSAGSHGLIGLCRQGTFPTQAQRIGPNKGIVEETTRPAPLVPIVHNLERSRGRRIKCRNN